MLFDVKKVPEPTRSKLIKLVGMKNIPSISKRSNIAERLNAKRGSILTIEGVGISLDYGISRKEKSALLKKIIKVI